MWRKLTNGFSFAAPQDDPTTGEKERGNDSQPWRLETGHGLDNCSPKQGGSGRNSARLTVIGHQSGRNVGTGGGCERRNGRVSIRLRESG